MAARTQSKGKGKPIEQNQSILNFLRQTGDWEEPSAQVCGSSIQRVSSNVLTWIFSENGCIVVLHFERVQLLLSVVNCGGGGNGSDGGSEWWRRWRWWRWQSMAVAAVIINSGGGGGNQ